MKLENPFADRRRQALGVGLGVGLLGAIALGLRYAFHKPERPEISTALSPAIFATRVQATSGGEIVYHISGTGDPVVFLHGVYAGASSFEWSRVYPHFTLGHEVIAPDLIGFGESERPAQALDLRDHSRSILEFLHHLCAGRRPVLVASGAGAKLALLLAAQHPELPAKIIIWQPTGVREALRGKAARRAIGISRLPWLRSLAWRSYLSSPEFLRAWASQIGFEEREARDDEAVEVLTTCAGLYRAENAVWAFLQGSFGEDLTPRLRDISCPVSILWPEESTLHDPRRASSLADELPLASLRKLPVRGLLAPLRHPALFCREIEGELTGFGEEADVSVC